MTSLSDLYDEYRLQIRGHTPVIPMMEEDYFILFKAGIRRLFIDTGRIAQYYPSTVTIATKTLSIDIGYDEQEYILYSAQAAYYHQILSDVAGNEHITQHKTDALTVSFSDKTVANIMDTIALLEHRLTELYHKMVQFAEAEAEE